MIRERHESIVELCKKACNVTYLSKALNITRMTARSDAYYLIGRGKLKNISINKNMMVLVSV